jgi:hypothetical protein
MKECNLIPDDIKQSSLSHGGRIAYNKNGNFLLAELIASSTGKNLDSSENSYKMSNLSKVEKLIEKNLDNMQRIIWDNTDYSLQASLFDDVYEPANITVKKASYSHFKLDEGYSRYAEKDIFGIPLISRAEGALFKDEPIRD